MLDIVTAERVVFSEEVDSVVAPGFEGQLGILPHHTSLMSALEAGELRIKQGGQELSLAISGGFLEVKSGKVIVLADTAERDDEIDLTRAEEARERARELLSQSHRRGAEIDVERAEAALRRSLARLKVIEKRRRRPSL